MLQISVSSVDNALFIKELSMSQILAAQKAVGDAVDVDLAAELIWRSYFTDEECTTPRWESAAELLDEVSPRLFNALSDEVLTYNGLGKETTSENPTE